MYSASGAPTYRLSYSINKIPAMMKYFVHICMLTAVLFGACSSTTEPTDNNPDPTPQQEDTPSIKQQYNTARGSVQITKIYYHQDSNFLSKIYNLNDEWIILEANGNIPTAGWSLDADDRNQRYLLPDTIYKKLYIYTRFGPGYENDTIMTLKRGSTAWIWNNTTPDTARLYNAAKELVDFLGYDLK